MFNSKFSQDQILLINKKKRKYRLFYSLLLKYYEIHTDFFKKTPKFSGSLITNITKSLNLPRTISTPSTATFAKYKLEIRDYFGADKKMSETLVTQYILEILPIRRSFDIDIKEIEDYLKKNKIPQINYLDRVVAKVIREYEDSLFNKIADSLDYESMAYLDGLLMIEQHLTDIMSKCINWSIIERYYDLIVKYTVALKQGRSDAENIMRIFTRNNSNHPVYKALRELGRAVKTIFLCKYLGSESLRREIHEGLNVVERWNGANDFIFYGKRRMLTGKNPVEFELQMLCLHILQLSMVYINTLLLQQILIESGWLARMTLADKRALTPLLSEHINPYGLFLLDMNKRLDIKIMRGA